MSESGKATIFAILAAAVYAINIPLSKIFLKDIEPSMMASLLYLGAGIGMFFIKAFNMHYKEEKFDRIRKNEVFFILMMILLDVIAPIFLMLGLLTTKSENVSLLNNFEIVVTSIVALLLFKEVISKKVWLAIILITIATIILSLEGKSASNLEFSYGSIFVILACFCWGLENNCTRFLSNRNSVDIVVMKGLGSGLGAFLIANFQGEKIPPFIYLILVMLLGFFAFGLSISFYIKAQKNLGAAKTSAYYAISPFLGVLFSFFIYHTTASKNFWLALFIMMVATYFLITDIIKVQHTHEHTHSVFIKHSHSDGIEHSHEINYKHSHMHVHTGELDKDEHEHEENVIEHEHKKEN